MCREIILDLSKWALIYQTIRVYSHPDIDINHLGYLRTSFGIYATLLMDILNNYSHIESNELVIDDKKALNKAFKVMVAYDASRFIANYPTGELARFIPTVFKRLSSDNYDQYESYADKFTALVSSTKEGYRLPGVATLKKSVISNDLYSRKRAKIKKLLVLLENIGKKEILNYEKDLKKAQIEHIMPQTLDPDKWSYISRDDHEKYLHTLGNLTLTFDNQKLSNMGFTEKKRILHEKSRIKMNNKLIEYDEFDIPQIEDRASSLLDLFLKEYAGDREALQETSYREALQETSYIVKQHKDDIKYLDSGKRTEQNSSIYNQLLEYFDELTGRTLDEASDAIIAAGWSPPSSTLFGTREEKVKYLRGYLASMIRDHYLLPVTPGV
jgi:hypothetical protein